MSADTNNQPTGFTTKPTGNTAKPSGILSCPFEITIQTSVRVSQAPAYEPPPLTSRVAVGLLSEHYEPLQPMRSPRGVKKQ